MGDLHMRLACANTRNRDGDSEAGPSSVARESKYLEVMCWIDLVHLDYYGLQSHLRKNNYLIVITEGRKSIKYFCFLVFVP